MKWYVLFVKAGMEEVVKQGITKHLKYVKCMVPQKKVPEKKDGKFTDNIRNIFPGYVFINTSMEVGMYYHLKKIPGILSLLNYQNSKDKVLQTKDESTYFKHVPDHEMAPLLCFLNNADIIDYSQIFLQGRKVIVKSGPLMGMEGIIKKVERRKNRAKVAFTFIGSEKWIDLGVQILSTEDSQVTLSAITLKQLRPSYMNKFVNIFTNRLMNSNCQNKTRTMQIFSTLFT